MGKPEYTDDVKAQLVKQVGLAKRSLSLGRRACRVLKLKQAQAHALGPWGVVPGTRQQHASQVNEPACIEWPFPGYRALDTLVQVEFYFSDSNLPKDRFLKGKVAEDPEGCEWKC
jgi:hypothetical protein